MNLQAEVYHHFHPDERGFIDKMLDWLQRCARFHEVKVTDFLDPRQCYILMTLTNRVDDVHCRLDGGYLEAECKRAVIGPDYIDLAYEPAGILVISVTSGDALFSSLGHGDFLGAVLGLGLKREKIGDIHVSDQRCDVMVAAEIADFVHLHLQQVHRLHVTTEILPPDQLLAQEQQWEELHFTVASMRLDGILSDVCRISRAKVLAPVKSGKCKVNWRVTEDPSFPLKVGDVVSLKGFGRFKIVAAEGVTKKGRIRLKVGKYESSRKI